MLKDLRYAIRSLKGAPGFTIVAVLALALGSGVNTAIFSVIDAVLLRPLPYPNADRLVELNEQSAGRAGESSRPISLSYPNFLDMRDRVTAFSAVAAYRFRGMNVLTPERAMRASVTQTNWEFFDLTGTRPILGRVFTSADDRVDAEPVAVISEGLWTRAFGRRPGILGEKISTGRKLTIIGVVPEVAEPFSTTDVFIPLTLAAEPQDGMLERGNHTGMHAMALLKPGATIEQARSQIQGVSADLQRQYPANAGIEGVVRPYLDLLVSSVRPGLWMLAVAVGLVLLIACVNVANLMLARSSARRREVAIRAALGAGRGVIVRQFLIESLVLAAAGSIVGTIAAVWVVGAVVKLSPDGVARISQAGIDFPVLVFTALVTIASAILFGLTPAIGASRTDVMDAMRAGGRSSTDVHARDRMRSVLLAAEVALSMMLLAGAGLMLRTIGKISRVDPGFDPRGLVAMNLYLPGYSGPRLAEFWNRALERVRQIPGVRAASATLNPPFENSSWSSNFTATNAPETDRAHMPNARFTTIGTRFFETMGIRLLRGREFSPADAQAKDWRVIVNQTLARSMWGDRDPIGQKIRPGYADSNAPWAEVIGVVADVKQVALDFPEQIEVYLPLEKDDEESLSMMVRASSGIDPASLAPSIAAVIREMDPNLPVYSVRTMEQRMHASYARERFITGLLETFALVALMLALVGIYGVTSYMVARATQEIGVRMALGARRADVLTMVLARALAPSGIGLAIGIAGAIVAARAMQSMLFEVSAADPLTLAGVAALFTISALAASLIPARRAMRVDPIQALRTE
jgi:putative ABC transport system permease protein